MTVVKICGVMDAPTALVALEAGADMLGFVLAPSRRQLSPEAAAEIVREARRRVPPGERPWLAVGVFANQPLDFVRSAASLAALDVVQLSGQEESEYSRSVNTTVYKTLHMGGSDVGRGFMPRRPASAIARGGQPRAAGDKPPPYVRRPGPGVGGRAPILRPNSYTIPAFRNSHGAERVVLDSGGTGTWGGTGRPFRWDLAGDAARDCLVAGGLDPRNVAEALSLLRPWGVDVSSGVEANGRKDPARIRAFITEVRRSDKHERED